MNRDQDDRRRKGVAGAAVLFSCLLFAGVSTAQVNVDQMCSDWGRLAEQVMAHRQVANDLDEALKSYGRGEVGRELVLKAYSTQRFSSPEYQNRAIEDFKNEEQLRCLKE